MTKDNEIKTIVPPLRFPEFRDTGEWNIKLLGVVADIIKGQQLNVIELNSNGTYPCLNGGIHPSGFTEDYNTLANTITISEGGNSCGYVNFVTTKFWCGGHCYAVSFKDKSIDKFFFYQYLKGVENKIMALRIGSGLPNIQKKSILNFYVSIPASDLEQKRIADCLGSLDDLISAVADKIEALKEHKKGLMQRLFPAEGKTVPTFRFPEFQNAGGWQEKKLGNIADIITGNTPSTADSNNYGGSKMFVSPVDISGRYITETKTTLSEKGFSITRHIKENSILFVCIGSTIGKIAQNKVECATNQQINSLIPHKGYVNDFIYSALEYNAPNIALIAGQQAVPIINKTLFSSVSLYIPDIKEQQKIADCLSSVDELISAENSKLDQLKVHKKGLMQRLFPILTE